MNPAIFDRPSGAGALLGPGDIATPTAGYSLRYLSINYFGQPVVRVRKDVVGNPTQDFTPNQLTDGTLASFADGNDCYVPKWYDQFGSNDATQASASAQPKIWDASTGLVTENGKPAVGFDGVDDILTSPITSVINSVIDVFANDSEYNTTNSREGILGTGAALHAFRIDANSVTGLISDEVLTVMSPVISNNRTAYGGSGVTIPSGQYLFGYYFSTEWSIYIDGSKVNNLESGAEENTAFQSDFEIKGGGKRQELIIYNSDQSANRETIENNINDYYDIY